MREALKLYGTKEIPGPEHNQVILDWAKEIGGAIANWYDADEKAWCALAMGICLKRAGYSPPPGFGVVRALAYADWGVPSQNDCIGDIAVFSRKGGGHVGLMVAKDSEAYHVLGGNQANAFNITRIGKNRLYDVRRCPFKLFQPRPLPTVNADGALSVNEA